MSKCSHFIPEFETIHNCVRAQKKPPGMLKNYISVSIYIFYYTTVYTGNETVTTKLNFV